MSAVSILLFALTLAGQPADGPLPTASQVRKAIERSLPYMMNGGMMWKAKTFGGNKQCISCHHIPLAVWTHNEAKAQGFAVDQPKVDALTDWMIGFSAAKKYPDEMVDGFLDTIFLASEGGNQPGQHRETFGVFQEMLAKQQLNDGSWLRRDGHNEPGFSIIPPGLSDNDAAKREAQEVDTMWALLGLNALERLADPLSEPARELLAKQRSAALALLKEAQGSTRSDWLAFRILIERDLGDKTKVGHWRQALLAQQNTDGGWGLVRGDPSHPLVTGQALYALGITGVGDDETAVQRAWRYLLMSQRDDGSWAASSRPMVNHRNYVTENFGTGWAVLGLLRTLP
jgi:hypothetical protein